jgi:hypothetical protein
MDIRFFLCVTVAFVQAASRPTSGQQDIRK